MVKIIEFRIPEKIGEVIFFQKFVINPQRLVFYSQIRENSQSIDDLETQI